MVSNCDAPSIKKLTTDRTGQEGISTVDPGRVVHYRHLASGNTSSKETLREMKLYENDKNKMPFRTPQSPIGLLQLTNWKAEVLG